MDNVQEGPDARIAHRTSPTNIGMGLLSTLAAHDLGFIPTGELIERIDSTLTTMEGLERTEGHLFNWYDTLTLAPLPPRYVSTVDSGNLAGALIAVSEGLGQLGRAPPPTESGPSDPCARLESLSRRAAAFADEMSFGFLYDPEAGPLLHRLPRRGRRGARPARSVPLRPPRLGGAARELHRDREGRRPREALVPPRPGGDERAWEPDAPVVERDAVRVPDAAARHAQLPGHAARRGLPDGRAAPARLRGASAQVPWGISESAYDVVDHHGNYQYKAFGVPGLGMKRGLADELVVAPYATALAALVDPTAAAANLRRLAREGLLGAYGYFDAIDYTPRRAEEPDGGPPEPGHGRPAGARSCGPTSPITRG